MSSKTTNNTAHVQEKTFSAYNEAQGENYSKFRPEYHPNVYENIVNHHTSTGGTFDTLIDIGCGPGTATHALAPKFTQVFGLDPSPGMISVARAQSANKPTSNVRFEVSTAEDLGRNLSPPIEENSVDLIISANAVHWFDMPRFWATAARVLKPKGTVALWSPGRPLMSSSTPNASKIEAAIEEWETEYLAPFLEPGNIIVRNAYVDLVLPWMADEPVTAFEEGSFIRKDWGVDEDFFAVRPVVGMEQLEKMIAVGSPVTRWREANPDAVGTEKDAVRVIRRRIEELLHEAGVEKGKEVLKGSPRGVLLMIKKCDVLLG
ncbi:hypothetical protein N7478_004111 [Penicillium angulare]|uniref:uncharacterized protein n=1 Tax=Penicillium angulare TaxID=116970 RepID=UPI002540EFBB|nr:uncharacterized protein N7478_004111 [Penicillium angulare]KAJ5278739.1 hypothetical protein N7478_004111 [Penicillium angulare]